MKKYRDLAKASQEEHMANMLAGRHMEHPKKLGSKPVVKRGGKVESSEVATKSEKPKARLDRYARGGKVKDKGRTTVNVIVAPGGDKGAAPPMPMPPPGAVPPPPMPSPRPPMGAVPSLPPGMMPPPGGAPMPMRKRGGKVEHPDAAEDKKLIRAMVKPADLKRAKGGRVAMTAGALSGKGRLEKTANAEEFRK